MDRLTASVKVWTFFKVLFSILCTGPLLLGADLVFCKSGRLGVQHYSKGSFEHAENVLRSMLTVQYHVTDLPSKLIQSFSGNVYLQIVPPP